MKIVRTARILGSVFQVFSAFLIVPLVGSLAWDRGVPASAISRVLPFDLSVTTGSFLISFLFVFLLGVLLKTVSPPIEGELREREAFLIVGLGWLVCAVLGALPFLLTGAASDPSGAVFESMSGITTTGMTALQAPLEQYPPSLHLWRASLHLFGGLAIVIVGAAVITRLTEGASRLMGPESASQVQRLRPKLSQTARGLFGLYLGFAAIVFFALWPAIHGAVAGMSWHEAAFHALVHAFGTVGTGGVSTRTDGIAAFGSAWVDVVVFLGMITAGVSFALLFRAVHGESEALWRNPEFRFYLTIVGVGGAVLTFLLYGPAGGFIAAAREGLFTAASAVTTTGYAAAGGHALPDGGRLVLLLLMITGGMVGSTAGGIKVGRIYLLVRLTVHEITRLLHPHALSVVKMGGRILPDDAMRRVVVFFFSYVTAFIAGAFAFATLGYDLSSSLAASAASLSNVGQALGAGVGFADAPALARGVATLLMWIGRLEIFTVLLLLVPATYRD